MNALRAFSRELRRHPVRAASGLAVEYGMFAAAVFLAGSLRATRTPLSFLDRRFGLGLRDRFIEFIARVSPG